MQRYGDYAPTAFDRKGLKLPTQQDWLVVIGRNRDSDPLAESNWHTAVDMLGGESDDVEIHAFDHWACGWLEIVIVRPGSDAAAIAAEIERKLGDYPALDEGDWSRREYDSYNEQWIEWGAADFCRELARKFSLSDAAVDVLERDKAALQEWFEELNPCGDYQDDGSPIVRRSVDRATRDDVARFIRAARQGA